VLGAGDARTVSRAINALPVEVPVTRSCPAGDGAPDYTLSFTGTSRPTVVTVDVSGCPHVQVQVDAVTQAPTLSGATSLAGRLDALLTR
jgi:hypothetical protein